MKTQFNILKSILLTVLLFISSTALAATYYVCPGATLSFTPPAPSGTISYQWDVQQAGTTVGAGFVTIVPVSGVYKITAPTTPGTYQVVLRSTSSDAAICAPADATNDFIVLPPLSLTIAAPSNPTYCGSATSNSSLITQSVTGFPAGAPYNADLEMEYSYTVAKDGGTAVDGTTGGLGSIDGTGKYTLSTTVPGSYVITGIVKYKQKTGFTNALLGSTGCPASSTTRTVIVTAAPSQPTITISAS